MAAHNKKEVCSPCRFTNFIGQIYLIGKFFSNFTNILYIFNTNIFVRLQKKITNKVNVTNKICKSARATNIFYSVGCANE